MNNVAKLCEDHCGGWEVVFSNVIDDKHILTISMVSVDACHYDDELHHKLHEGMSSHSHRKIVKTEAFIFDHYPSDEEIEEELINNGFNPIIQECIGYATFAFSGNVAVENNTTLQMTAPIKTVTEGQEDVFEYSALLHPEEFDNLYGMLPITVEDRPTSMSIKGSWLYLYYVRDSHSRPTQFFDDDYFLYSVRVHKDTGQVVRKGYNKGLTLTEEEISTLQDAETFENIIATGYYLDEPRITLYHMRSSEPEDFVNNPAIVEIPYLGTTWENGSILHTREYMRDEIT